MPRYNCKRLTASESELHVLANAALFRRIGLSLRFGSILLVLWLSAVVGCDSVPGVILPSEAQAPIDEDQFELLVRFVQISDAQIVDEESPARLTWAGSVIPSAWRPQERFSTQLLDGTVRAVNKIHVAKQRIDFLIHTGDAVDNSQLNELNWFITALDGGLIEPRTGPDDRNASDIPKATLDPHASFIAQGLYRQNIHGDLPTIEWYATFGNHDHFAVGVFPIVTNFFGRRVGPLPLFNRLPITAPLELDPLGMLTWGLITPAMPGPTPTINFPVPIPSNPNRRYFTKREFIASHLASTSMPIGHGFSSLAPDRSWYSVAPVPGVRLLVLNSASPGFEVPTGIYSEGAISTEQIDFLTTELERAQAAKERVIVATHHPSGSLEVGAGTAISSSDFIALLNRYSVVTLHIAGHWHQNVVIDRGSYVEMVTGSIIDPPQTGRVIEIWKNGDRTELRYYFFSHLDEIDPPSDAEAALFNDPLLPMRQKAAEIAGMTVKR